MPTAEILLSSRDYDRLVRDLRVLLTSAQQRAREAVALEAARTYWEVGRRIAKERAVDRSGYESALQARIAEDLGLHVRTLRRATAFYRAFPKRPPPGLGWTHARELLRVHDSDARGRLAALARAEGLSARKLAAAVDAHLLAPDALVVEGKGRARIVRPEDPTYIYGAEVLRVVDGDTLDLRIDLGFDVDKRHRIRLAAIDAPERRTEEGKAAARFVEDTLAAAATVVIQTRKFDLYGRYVAHLYYSSEERSIAEVFATGRYLNQLLLDRGHAVPYARGVR